MVPPSLVATVPIALTAWAFTVHCPDSRALSTAVKTLFLIFVKKQSQELTRVNPDRNIFSINVELTSTFLLYRGLVHHQH